MQKKIEFSCFNKDTQNNYTPLPYNIKTVLGSQINLNINENTTVTIDLGTTTKSLNYSVLYMKAVKALQESMERIETLEQRLSDAGIA